MYRTRAVLIQCVPMVTAAVAFMAAKAVDGKFPIELAHQRVAVGDSEEGLRIELSPEARCSIRVSTEPGDVPVGARLVLSKDEARGFPDLHTATRDLTVDASGVVMCERHL